MMAVLKPGSPGAREEEGSNIYTHIYCLAADTTLTLTLCAARVMRGEATIISIFSHLSNSFPQTLATVNMRVKKRKKNGYNMSFGIFPIVEISRRQDFNT